MTIILFLIDTSASMNQRTYLGARPTLLDVAKDAVERFIKVSICLRVLINITGTEITILCQTVILILNIHQNIS